MTKFSWAAVKFMIPDRFVTPPIMVSVAGKLAPPALVMLPLNSKLWLLPVRVVPWGEDGRRIPVDGLTALVVKDAATQKERPAAHRRLRGDSQIVAIQAQRAQRARAGESQSVGRVPARRDQRPDDVAA